MRRGYAAIATLYIVLLHFVSSVKFSAKSIEDAVNLGTSAKAGVAGLGDVDGDGDLDVAYCTASNKVGIRSISSAGVIASTEVEITIPNDGTSSGPSCTAVESVGDLDCDGKPDLVILHRGTSNSRRVTGHKLDMDASSKISSTALFTQTLTQTGDPCTNLFTADYSDDGHLDILVSCATDAAWTVVIERDPATGCRTAGTSITTHASRFQVWGKRQFELGFTTDPSENPESSKFVVSQTFPAVPDSLDGVGNFMTATHDSQGFDGRKRGGMFFVVNLAPKRIAATWCGSNCGSARVTVPDTSADPPITVTTLTTMIMNTPPITSGVTLEKAGLGRCVGGGLGPNNGAIAMLGVSGEFSNTVYIAPMGSGGGPGSCTSLLSSPSAGDLFRFIGDIDGNGVTDMIVSHRNGGSNKVVLLETSGFPLPYTTASVEPGYECCYPTTGGAATPGSKKLRVRVTLPSPTAVTLWTASTIIGDAASSCVFSSWVPELTSSAGITRTGVYECTTPALSGTGLSVTVSVSRQGVSNAMISVFAGTISSEGPIPTGWTAATPSQRVGGSSWQLTVTGRNFGSSPAQQAIFIAGRECEEYGTASNSQTSIVCSKPPACVGKGFNVSVSIAGAYAIVPGPLLDYAPPVVTAIQLTGVTGASNMLPTAALNSAGGQSLLVTGTGFGFWDVSKGFRFESRTCSPDPTASIPDSLAFAVTVRGVPATSMTWVSSTGIRIVTPPGSGTSPPLVLAVMGQSVTVDTSSLLSAAIRFSPPVITRLSQTSNLDVGGTTKLLVTGTGFGVPGHVASLGVTVGGLACVSPGEVGDTLLDSGHIAATAIECIAPSLVGSQLPVVVTADGQSSPASPSEIARVSYAQPTLTAVSPERVLAYPASTAAQHTITVELTGANLGRSSADLSAISIAGYVCPSANLQWVSATQVNCVNVVPAVGSFTDRTIDIKLSGGASNSDRGLGLLTVMDAPRVLSVESGSTGSVDGITAVELLVEDAGFVTADIVSVRAGPDVPCTGHELSTTASGQLLKCTITGGTGSSLPFSFTTRTGATSAGASARFSFDKPVVTLLQFPGQAVGHKPVLMAGQSYSNIVVSGASLGIKDRFEPNVSIAGVPCQPFSLINGTTGLCESLAPPMPSGLWPSRALVLTSGPTASFKDDLAVTTLGAPEIFDVSPRQSDTSGGSVLEIIGVNLGTSASQVTSLTLGSKACPLTDALPDDPTKLRCRIPSGTGQGLKISLLSSTGLVATSAGLFSYSPVTLTRVSPSQALTGPANLSFVISGSSLGSQAGDVTGASVGGVACGNTTRISASSVRCDDAWAGNGWSSTQAVVQVYGTDVSVSNVFTGLGLPVIRSVSPAALSTTGLKANADPDTLTVIGSALIGITRVLIGTDNVECLDVQPIGSTGEELTCNPPSGTGTGRFITVINSLGGQSSPQRLVSYQRPVVSSLSPDRFLAPGPSYGGVDVVITGEHFGTDISSVERVVIGGKDCDTIVMASNIRRLAGGNASTPRMDIACQGFSGTLLDDNVVVVVSGQQSDAKPLIKTRFASPVIASVAPATMSVDSPGLDLGPETIPHGSLEQTVSGPRDVTISGSGFGWTRNHVTSVLVGSLTATILGVEADSATSTTGKIRIRVPDGTGLDAPIRVVSAAGNEATADFGFKAPKVYSTSPKYVLPYAADTPSGKVNVTLYGSDLGHAADAVDAITAGGVACGGIEWKSSSEVVCTGLDATGDWENLGVTVSLKQLATPALPGGGIMSMTTPFVTSREAYLGSNTMFPMLTLPRIDSVTIDGDASVAGGWNISIINRDGSGFGLVRSDIASVRVGALVISPEHIDTSSPGRIVAVMPPGSGSNLPVTVTTATGAEVTGGTVSYDRAVVSGLVPPVEDAQLRVFAFAGDTSPINIGVIGSSLASSAEGIDRVEICADAGSPCAVTNAYRVACRMPGSSSSSSSSSAGGVTAAVNSGTLSFESSTRLTCSGITLPALFPSGRATVAVFTAASPDSPAAAATSALTVLAAPIVAAVSPASGPTGGGTEVEILGSGFGSVATDQLIVRFGGAVSDTVSLVSDSKLTAVTPPGVGTGVSVTVQTRSSEVSAAVPLFSYAAPEVISAEPRYGFVGQSDLSLMVTGRNFGNARNDVTSLMVSGVHCPSAAIQWLSPTSLRCTGMDGSGLSNTDAKVVVDVGGSISAPNAAFSALPAPIVNRLSPSIASAGSEVTLVGDYFGRSASDVVSITIGGQPCPHLVQLHSPGSIACVVPQPSDDKLELAEQGDTSVLTGLAVVVVTRGGLSSFSDGSDSATFSYPGFEDYPWAATIGGVGFRPVGERSTLLLQWLLPVSALDGLGVGGAPITSFSTRFSTSRADLQASLTSQTLPDAGSTVAELSILRASLQRVLVLPGGEWAMVSARLFGLTSPPQYIALAPVNARGRGEWAMLQEPVNEECLPGTFLRDTASTADGKVCTVCPEGGFCPGYGGSAGVLGRSGFWRIPWTNEGLGFMVCPRPDSCAGVTDAEASNLAKISLNRETAQSPLAASAIDVASHLAEVAPGAVNVARNATGSLRYPSLPVAVVSMGARINGSTAISVDVTEAITLGLTVAAALVDPSLQPLPAAFTDPASFLPATIAMLPEAQRSDTATKRILSSSEQEEPATDSFGGWSPLSSSFGGVGGRTALTAEEVAAEAAQLGLSPSELDAIMGGEGCDIGYQGVACASCATGFAPQGGFTCSPCPEQAVSTSLGLLLGLIVATVVCLLVYRTLQNGGAEGRLESAAMKVLFTHLQTIAITAALPLQWPADAQVMFDLASASTTISSETFSVDCGLDGDSAPGQSRFFTRSILILLVPVMCLTGGALLWSIQAWLCPARSTTIARQLKLARRGKEGPDTVNTAPKLNQAGFSSMINPLSTQASSSSASATSASAKSKSSSDCKELTPKPKPAARPSKWSRLSSAVSNGVGNGDSSSDAKALGLPQRSLLQSASSGSGSASSLAAAVLEVHRRNNLDSAIKKQPPGPWKVATSRWVVSTIIILFLLHTTLVRTALQIFTCIPVVAAGTAISSPSSSEADVTFRALQADMSVDCASGPAQTMMATVGWPALVIYALGIPIGAALLLWNKRLRLSRPNTRALYGFLYAGFKPSWYFWESIIMLRKVGIAICSVLMAPFGIETQTYCALALVIVAVTLHARAWPYSKVFLNSLELLSLLTAAATLFAALFLLSAQGRIAEAVVTGADISADVATVEATTVVLVGSNAAFLAVALLAIANAVWQSQPESAPVPRALRGIRSRITRAVLAWCCTADGRSRAVACCTKPTGSKNDLEDLYKVRKATGGPAVASPIGVADVSASATQTLFTPPSRSLSSSSASSASASSSSSFSLAVAVGGTPGDSSTALTAMLSAAKLDSVASKRALGVAVDPARVRA